MSFYTGTNVELLYASTAAGTSRNTFTAETNMNDTAAMGPGVFIPADFWLPSKTALGRGFRVVARFVIGTTATPTFTLTVRMGSTQGATTGTVLLGSATITTISGAAAALCELEGEVILEAIGAAGANSTIRGLGTVTGRAFSASGDLFGGNSSGASPGTATNVDTSVKNFINVNAACGTSNVANTIQLLQLQVYGLN